MEEADFGIMPVQTTKWRIMKQTVPYKLRYSNRSKRLRIEVVPGEVRVVAPVGSSIFLIDEFVRSKERWIIKKITAFNSTAQTHIPAFSKNGREVNVLGRLIDVPPENDSPDDLIHWLDGMLMAFLTETQMKYTKLVPSRVRIGNARTRWGSCSVNGVVMINSKLVHAPADVVEYVFVHELVHLEHRNHSIIFWDTVRHYLGEVKPQKRWLRLQGAHLL